MWDLGGYNRSITLVTFQWGDFFFSFFDRHEPFVRIRMGMAVKMTNIMGTKALVLPGRSSTFPSVVTQRGV